MPTALSPANTMTPRTPRDLNYDRNSRQHSEDSAKPSATPITARQPSSLTPIATIAANVSLAPAPASLGVDAVDVDVGVGVDVDVGVGALRDPLLQAPMASKALSFRFNTVDAEMLEP